MADDPMAKLEIPACEAMRTATALRDLMAEAGIGRFSKEHLVRRIETKLVEASKAAVGWVD